MSPPADPLAAVLPHRAPFRFVDDVVALDEAGGRFRLDLSADDPRLGDAKRLPPLLLLEALAQSAAAYHGLTAPAGRGAEQGVLVQIDRAELACAPGPGSIELAVRKTHVLGPFVRFAGEARTAGALLARCEITVARGEVPRGPE